MKKYIFYILKVTEDFGFGRDPDPHPNLLVRGTDPRIRIRTKCHGSGSLIFKIQLSVHKCPFVLVKFLNAR
jgi:hypothetical protein